MEKEKKIYNHKKIMIIIVIITLVIDQVFKIISIKFGFCLTQDEAISENNGYYIVLSIFLIALIIRYLLNDNSYIKMSTKILMSFAISGVLSNMIDRIWYKKVITFIKLGNDIFFNFAYIYIIIAWIGMVLLLTKNTSDILKDRKKQSEMIKEYEENREEIKKEFEKKKQGKEKENGKTKNNNKRKRRK